MHRKGAKAASARRSNPNAVFCTAVFAAAALWGFKVGQLTYLGGSQGGGSEKGSEGQPVANQPNDHWLGWPAAQPPATAAVCHIQENAE
jgi:hypothetical protein